MNIGYFQFVHRPGEKRGVLGNGGDKYQDCKDRVHCNATHDHILGKMVWDEQEQKYVADNSPVKENIERFKRGMHHSVISLGDHNNVYFPGFLEFKDKIPESLMQDPDGNYLELHDRDILNGQGIPMPAIDDPTLIGLRVQMIRDNIPPLRYCHFVSWYSLTSEMLYPEYFGLGNGDYRPASWKHFEEWCKKEGFPVPEKKATLIEGSEARITWLKFREAAMADRCRIFYQAQLIGDDTHLGIYQIHGSDMHGTSRACLGQETESLAAACDGMNSSHIVIDDDRERRNVILTSHMAAYGTPAMVTELGCKVTDMSAKGSGRSFSPTLIRRYLYELFGLGVTNIYPITWTRSLHDGEWFIKDTPTEEELRRIFDEFMLVAPYANAMGRLQPQLGILAPNETWIQKYRPCWTGMMQDALKRHIQTTIITDAKVDRHLARVMPVLLCAENVKLGRDCMNRLLTYLDAGGHAVLWGAFAETDDPVLREKILSHPNTRTETAPAPDKKRVLREQFLAGRDIGTSGPRYIYYPAPFDTLISDARSIAPEAVLSPFEVTGADEADTSRLNVYALTDRAAMMAVCVNTANTPIRFSLKPDERLMRNWAVEDAMTGRPVTFPMTLPENGTAVLFFGHPVDEDTMEESVCKAEDAFECLKRRGANMEPYKMFYGNCRAGSQIMRRYALAEAMNDSIGIRTEYQKDETGNTRILCHLEDGNGEPVHGAAVTLRVSPGTFDLYDFEETADGYLCTLDAATLPAVYDVVEQRYIPITGNVRLIIQAECGNKQGGSIVTARI